MGASKSSKVVTKRSQHDGVPTATTENEIEKKSKKTVLIMFKFIAWSCILKWLSIQNKTFASKKQ